VLLDISYHQPILVLLAQLELLPVLPRPSLLVLLDISNLEVQSPVILVEKELMSVPLPLKLPHVSLDII
jgi:hypothetical protein